MKLKISIVNNNDQLIAKAVEPNCSSLIINGIVLIANGEILIDTPFLEDHEAEHGVIEIHNQERLN
tara:strand:+ start:383 stop:580 length:198 start_codon:yes stop_codon:yes gene_type:complete